MSNKTIKSLEMDGGFMEEISISVNLEEKRLELMKSFFALGGNHDLDKMLELQPELESYLENYEDSDDKKIENTLHLLKAWIHYHKTNDVLSSHKLVLPMMKNLNFGHTKKYLKDFYNIMILSMSVLVCEDYEQALTLAKDLETAMFAYYKDKLKQQKIMVTLYSNLAEVLLQANRKGFKHKEIEGRFRTDVFPHQLPVDEKYRVVEVFDACCKRVLDISFENGWNVSYAGIISKQALFRNNQTLLNTAKVMFNLIDDNENMSKFIESIVDDYKHVESINVYEGDE